MTKDINQVKEFIEWNIRNTYANIAAYEMQLDDVDADYAVIANRIDCLNENIWAYKNLLKFIG